MASVTKNIRLPITKRETNKTFLDWRLGVDGPDNSAFQKLDAAWGQLVDKVNAVKNLVGTPAAARTTAEMTDTSKAYVYTGEEPGYTRGNWYYHDGSAWVSGGVYQATAIPLDETLTEAGAAADAAAVGRGLQNRVAAVEIVNNKLHVYTGDDVEPDEYQIATDTYEGLHMEYDEETNLLHLYDKNNTEIGDPVKIVGGGGGSGGGNNAVIAVQNVSGWQSRTLPSGASCPISITWSSLEDENPTGNGTVKVVNGGVTKAVRNVSQGTFTIDIGSYLNPGDNAVRVTVTDIYGNYKTIIFNVKYATFSLNSTFDASTFKTGRFSVAYTPSGGKQVVTLHHLVDGHELASGTEEIRADGKGHTFEVPAQAHGAHTLEFWFESDIDGETTESNRLYYEFISVEAGNNTPIISTSFRDTTAAQYATINIPYIVYSSTIMSDIQILVNGRVVSTLSVDRSEHVFNYRADDTGALTVEIVCGYVTRPINLTVEESEIHIEPATDQLVLHLTSEGRSNDEAHPEIWEDEERGVECQLSNFDYVTNGWIQDKDGAVALRVSGDARVTIPFKPFAEDFRTSGKTIEIEFATRAVLDYDAVIISCMNGGRGIQLTSQRAALSSEQTTISTQYKEDEHVRISFVVEKRSENRLLYVYINGIMSGVVQYMDDDDFAQQSPVNIAIGSNSCATDIYCIRVYDTDLTRYQIVSNWIADTHDINTMIARYEHNDLYDSYNNIVISKLPKDLPYMILDAPELPGFKGDKKTISGSYTDPLHPEKSFTFSGCQINVQGTSSAEYARKNYDMQFKAGFEMSGGEHADNYALADGIVPFNRFVVKADVASSESANNVELVKLFIDANPFKTREQMADPRVRSGIYGFPIVIFWHNTEDDSTTMLGKYNFNLPKRAPGPYGYSGDMESWEFQNNTSNLMLFLSDYFSEAPKADPNTGDVKAAWRYDYEARFPSDEWVDYSKLQEFQSFVYSTYRAGATGNALPSPVTYSETRTVYDEVVDPETGAIDYVERLVTEDVTYTNDTPEYRLSKFYHEFGNYAEVDSFIFYYIFTELFLMVDSRAKNLFIGFSGSDTDPSICRKIDRKVVAEPYDMDTAIGTNNEGVLVFGYSLEDTDHLDGGADVFNGQNSVLWCNLRDAFPREIAQMYKSLRSAGILSYDTVSRRFEDHQAKWPEAVFNDDAQFKYLDPLVNPDPGKAPSAAYLSMLQGSKAQQRKWWLYNRFQYMDSKWNAGDALDNVIQLRGYEKADITVTPYADIYPTVKYGSYPITKRGQHGVPTVLECTLDNINDTEIYIYSAPQIASVGDLSGLKVGFADFSKATKLQSIKVGSAASGYTNGNLKTLTVGQNAMLGTVDARNCINLTGGVDLSGASNIEHVYFDGTKITSCTLPVGGIVKTLHLPETVTNLTVRNQTQITDFSMPGYANITTLRIENSPAIPVADILEVIPANSRVRLIGFSAVMSSTSEVEEFYSFLDTMRGLDEAGNNTDRAVVSGKITGLGAIDGAWLAEMQARYPEIEIIGTGVSSKLRYYNYNGTMLLHTDTIEGRGDGTYTGTPEREDTAQYDYTFVGWNLSKNQTVADPNAVKNVMGDRNVYAAYSVVTRQYTVTWLDDDGSVLKTETLDYGATPNYGRMPKKDGVTAIGWEPDVVPVTGDASYTARYGYRVRFYNGAVLLKQVNQVAPGTVVEYIDSEHPENPTKTNYRFDGWTPAVAAVNSDVDYYAKFVRLYTVRFYNTEADIGGTALKTVTGVDQGASIAEIIADEAPETTAPAHKVFDTWYPASGTVEGDTDIAARYYDVYTVEFYNDADAVTPLYRVENLRDGETAVYSGETPSIDGKDFTGAWVPSNVVAAANADANNVIKCYAQYSDKHVVRFINVDTNHVLETVYVSNGDRADYTGAAFEHPYNAVLQFLGWNPALTTEITEDTDFYAVYEPSFTVRFYEDSAKTKLLKTVEYVEEGGTAAYGTNPAKTGYNFKGWVPANTGIRTDTDCVAQWAQVFTVTFRNMDNTVLDTVTVEAGSNAEYSGTPVHPHNAALEFTGWSPSNLNIQANTTCVAQYETSYTVLFKNGTTTKQTFSYVKSGTTVAYSESAPTNTDNTTWLGWSETNGATTATIGKNESVTVTADKTFYAVFNPAYTVTFRNQADTSTLQTKKVEKGGTASYTGSTPTNTDGTGFGTDFLGWASSKNATAVTEGVLENITANKTVYAAHKAAYTVTFYNGSSVYDTVKVQTGGTAVCSKANPTGDTEFLGWAATNGASSADPDVLKNITANKSVYAVFASSWDAVFAAIDDGTYAEKYHIGDTIPLNLSDGNTLNMEVVGIDIDDPAYVNGKAPLTMISKNLFSAYIHNMNSSATTTGGWEATGMRTYLNETIFPKIPEEVAGRIIPVTKRTKYYNVAEDVLTADKIWIPSEYEIGLTGFETGGVQYAEAFPDAQSRIKIRSTTASIWWLRSADSTSSFRSVSATGATAGRSAKEGNGVAIGFCVGKEVIDAEITDDWSAILSSIDNGTYKEKYPIGSYKPLDLGTEGTINMQIVAMNEDDLADGSGKAPITMIGKELLKTTQSMNSSDTTSGGWAASSMRTYLNNTILPLIPAEVAGSIKPVTKYSSHYNSAIQKDVTSTDKLWIPSVREIFGGTEYETLAPVYGLAFPNTNSRKKYKVGSSQKGYWWLRSASSDRDFYCVAAAGNNLSDPANSTMCVAIGFCLGGYYTWPEVFKSIDDGTYAEKYKIGDTVELKLSTNETVDMEIVGIDADDMSGRSGKAPLTFIAAKALSTTQAMNNSGKNTGGWAATVVRTYLNETVFPTIPSEVSDRIVPVAKHTKYYNVSDDQLTSDKLWIPSVREMCGTGSRETSGVQYTEAFPDNESRSGRGSSCWLRTADTSQTGFKELSNTGTFGSRVPSYKQGVLLGFSIGPDPVISDSWDEILTSVADGTAASKYSIGDYKELDLGSEGKVNMKIAAFDADDLADGSGKAKVTWISEQILKTSKAMNPALVTNYIYPDAPSWKLVSDVNFADEFSTQNKYKASTAKATWTVTANTAGTLTVSYKTSSSDAEINTLDVTVNGVPVATGWTGTSYTDYTVECAAGDTVTVIGEYKLLADENYSGSIKFASTKIFSVEAVIEDAPKRTIESYGNGTGAIGGWENSMMRVYLTSTIQPLIEAGQPNLMSAIKSVKKYSNSYDTAGTEIANAETADKLWIPSHKEMGSANAEETGPSYMTGILDISKGKPGETSNTNWWLRTANTPTAFRYVKNDGSVTSSSSGNVQGVVLGFCT